MNEILLAPSILAGNHANLAESLNIIDSYNLQWVHIDIMDGHFVPNLTFGPQTVADLRKGNDRLFFDTHLMLDNPQDYIEAFAKAGADQITIHVEPEYDIEKTLKEIKKLGCKAGITLNPDTPWEDLKPYLHIVELVLVMTVQPGFGGQSFREDMMSKLKALDTVRTENNYSYRLQVDGGVNADTGKTCMENGADTLVAGSAFFNAADKNVFIQALGAK